MNDIPFILLVQARAKPEFLGEIAEAAAATLKLTLKEAGCMALYQTTQAADPNHLCFFEYFTSEAAHQEHMTQPYTQAFFRLLEGKLLSEPVIQKLNLRNG
ncbi:putative quinol monooxygenase [Acerihabitans sp.]|uniref:putative quinol monooxygenase n=1 Tax=Acerihabitans sp. TaxID=2811394 RepID=UPI002ED7F1D0